MADDCAPATDYARIWAEFEGFEAPGFTMVPNIVCDVLMAGLSGNEFKCLSYIMRHTFGYGKDADSLSIDQFMNGIVKIGGDIQDRGTGLSRSSVTLALRGLRDKGLLTAEEQRHTPTGSRPTIYRLRFGVATTKLSQIRVAAESAEEYPAPTPPLREVGLPTGRQGVVQSVAGGSSLASRGVVQSLAPQKKPDQNKIDQKKDDRSSGGLDLSKSVQSPFIGATAPQPIFQDSLLALPAPKKAARKRPATDRAWPEWAIAWLAGFMAQMGWGDGTKAETKNRILLAVANDLESKTERQRADFLRYLFSDDKIKNSHEWVTRNVQQALEAWLAEGMPATRSKAAPPSFSSGYRGKPGGKNEWEEVYNETRRKEGEESRKTECPECWCPQGWHSNQCSLWTEGTIRCDPITNPWRKAKADEKRKELAAYREAAMQRKDYLR